MKILLTTHQFLPEHTSGTEILTYSVAKELLAQGHLVTVFTGFPASKQLSDSERFDRYELEGMQVVRFHHSMVPMGDQSHVTEIEYCNLLAASHFKQLVAEVSPDVIHFFHLSRLGAALMDVAFTSGIPAFYTPTDFWSICPTSQLLLDDGRMCTGPSKVGGNCVKHVAVLTRGARAAKVIRLVPQQVAELGVRLTVAGVLPPYRYSHEVAAMSRRQGFIAKRLNALTRIISPTTLMTDVLLANGIDNDRIVQSAYGIDTSFYEGYQRQASDQTVVTIGFIGTLASHKGCHILLEAMRLLDSPNYRLKVYGRSTDFPDYYKQLTNLAGADQRIEFCGTFPNVDIGLVLSGIDVLVVPSLWYENTPLVIYSAQASRCPVIASDFPGMSEVVRHGENGLLFAPGNAQQLKEQLLRLSDEAGLLANLRDHCKRPKSTQEYVTELSALYVEAMQGIAAPEIKSGWLEFASPFVEEAEGRLIGWAVMRRQAPVAIRLTIDGQPIAETRLFLPRVDVKDGFGKGGNPLKTSKVGFVLSMPLGIDKQHAVLELVGKSGEICQIPLRNFESGNSFSFPGEAFLGLDSERWE